MYKVRGVRGTNRGILWGCNVAQGLIKILDMKHHHVTHMASENIIHSHWGKSLSGIRLGKEI